jgi:uncharacterized SAM-dependent methyltransferase
VTFPNGAAPAHIEKGESIRTEISCKYDRATIDLLFSKAGLVVERWVQDPEGFFALMLAARQ